MQKILKLGAVLGLFMGGLVLGQAFSIVSIVDIRNSEPDDLSKTADALMNNYATTVARANGAAQVNQVASEVSVRMQYIQIKQNAEIIRLLKERPR